MATMTKVDAENAENAEDAEPARSFYLFFRGMAPMRD
jgi:hypothetical protein